MGAEIPGNRKNAKEETGFPAEPEADEAIDPKTYLQQFPGLQEDLKSLFQHLGKIPGEDGRSSEGSGSQWCYCAGSAPHNKRVRDRLQWDCLA